MDRKDESGSSDNQTPEDMTSSPTKAASPLGNSEGNVTRTSGGSDMNSMCAHDMISSPMKAASPLGNSEAYVTSTCGEWNLNSMCLQNSSFGQVESSHPILGSGRGDGYDNIPQRYSQDEFGRGSGHCPDIMKGKEIDPGAGPSAINKGDSMDPVSPDASPRWGPSGISEEDSFDPELYYDKEMLADPWEGLTPIIWRGPTFDKS